MRRRIMLALHAQSIVTFGDMKALLHATDGNLSAHARKLEDAGLIRCVKNFENRMPKTEYHITDAGRQALLRHVREMESLIQEAR